MTTSDLVDRVALDCRIATEAPDVAVTLFWRIKAALTKLAKRGVLATSGNPVQWVVKPGGG
jgi:hypothetical protein